MEFTDTHIIITGAASGIGKAILTLLAKENCSIIAVDYNAEALQNAIQEINLEAKAHISPFIADLSDATQIDALFEFSFSQKAFIDVFIANAGFAYYEKIGLPDWEHTQKIFQLNVFSPIYTLQKMKQSHPNRKYLVCVTASAMAKMGLAGYALYSATKAALDRFADAYNSEKDDLGILSLVYPVATRTNFFKNAASPLLFPSQTPEVVARAIVRGIKSEKKKIYPSGLFRLSYFFGYLQELLNLPYQYYCKKILNKWIS